MTIAELQADCIKDRGLKRQTLLNVSKPVKDALKDGLETDAAKMFTVTSMAKIRAAADKRQANTSNTVRRVYFIMAKQAKRRGLIAAIPNPDLWPWRKEILKQPVAFTKQEISAMFAAVDRTKGLSPRTKLAMTGFLAAAYCTGARVQHIMSAPRDALDIETSTVNIVDTKGRKERTFSFKGSTMPFFEAIVAGLATSKIHPRYKYLVAIDGKEVLTKVFKAVCDEAGIIREDGQLFHALRKSCGTHIAAARGVVAAAEHLGHTNIQMTLDHYIDPTQVPVRSHCDALDCSIMLPQRTG
jgi:integrase